MNCPYCEGPTRVVDSRPLGDGDGIRRRRECQECEKRFTTHERLAPAELKVLKAGHRPVEEFQVDKLARSLWRVLKGTGLGRADADRLARRIELELTDEGLQQVASRELARRALRRLKGLDQLAWERLAVNYRTPDGGWVFDREDEQERSQMGLFAGDEDDRGQGGAGG